MSDICEVLKSIYGNVGTPVVVFNSGGEAIWLNGEAESSLKNGGIYLDDVYQEIFLKKEKSGYISFGFGGKYNKTCLLGTECFIVELYDSRRILELFADPKVYEFVQAGDAEVRRSITGISASCEAIKHIVGEREKNETVLYLNHIMSSCCKVVDSLTIFSLLSASVEGAGDKSELIAFDDFLDELAGGCRNAFGNQCEVAVTEKCGGIIRADKSMVIYFVLILMRRLIDSIASNNFRLELSSSMRNDRVKISIAVLANSENERVAASRESLRLNDDILVILAGKLDARYTFYGSMMNVSFPLVEEDGNAMCCSGKVVFSDEIFSPYNIILNESGRFRNYY